MVDPYVSTVHRTSVSTSEVMTGTVTHVKSFGDSGYPDGVKDTDISLV